ncbi:hypothetical protein SEA_STEAMY_82 [Mycobacterium phage Steamy]|uniref:Gp84-like domain-containing protein n=1 Tax=Mycobacterium phage Steamy TaxID=2250309 RepID=A0A345L0Q4_9CAUD|nr:hypothetical protein KIV62_gp19 [Mycobacterium phage Steamy]AXH48856.1 hypothetical protein SEA_STEAMY_82 [Mycobacterium phage Steamy]
MFTLTTTKVGSDHTGTVTGSHRAVVIDHLEASAARHGFEVFARSEDGTWGDICRDGMVVGEWKLTEV